MDRKIYYNLVSSIEEVLYDNSKIQLLQHDSPTASNRAKIPDIIEKYNITLGGFKGFFEYFKSFTIKWEQGSENSSNGESSSGAIRILPVENIFINGKDIVYFDHTPPHSPLRDFFIVDFFADEACTGFYLNHAGLPGMHFFEFENQTYPMHIDLDGYLKLLGETRGFLYWPKTILDYLAGKKSPFIENFKIKMQKLFPDFDYQKYIALYESLRVDT